MSEDLSQYWTQNMPRTAATVLGASSVNTSPTSSTPSLDHRPFLDPFSSFNAFDWNSSASESNSPGSHYGCSRLPYSNEFNYENAMPEAPPSDIFTPSLIRRPPPSQTRSQKIRYNFCVFCKNNGEDESVYMAHTLKNDHGQVTCPILFNYTCPICKATGAVSHTVRYCPLNKDQSYQSEMAHITVLKQMRTSTGRRPSTPGKVNEFEIKTFFHMILVSGVIGGPIGQTLPPSKRPMAALGGRTLMSTMHQFRESTTGPNAAWSSMTSQPCDLMPMQGEYLNQEARRERQEYEQRVENLCRYATQLKMDN